MPSPRRYPDAPRQDIVQELHGQRVPDPYRWLEDAEDPRTLRWTAEQEILYRAERATWPDADRWRAKLMELTAINRVMTPKARGSRIFLARQRAGDDHPVLYVREGGTERPLLDVHALDPEGRTVLEAWEPSVEGDRLAYQLSRDGTEDSLLWVLDVATGAIIDGPIDRVRRTTIGWLPGGEAFYYVSRLAPELHPGEERYHRRVYLHKVGADRDTDVMVFGEGREKTSFYSVTVTPDGRWLTVTATVGTSPATDVYLADLRESLPDRPALRPIQEGAPCRTRLHVAPGTGPHDPVWLRTDRDAPRRRVVTCTPATPDVWRELIPERPDAVLADLAVLTGPQLDRPIGLVSWIRGAAAEITVHDLTDGRELDTLPLPGVGTVGGFSVRPPGHEVWFSYTDHATPPRVLHYDARTGRLQPWEAGNEPRRVVTRTQTCRSADGTPVRMFVLSKTGRPDRPRPAILTGYGGFGVSMSPGFSAQIAAWVEAGGIVAVACLRGGGEEGEHWHRDGRGTRKRNTFDDFDAAADHLVETGWTTPDRLGIMGGSNGGLVVGVALTRRPGAYAAAVCMSPLLDMARYELSGLGPSWVPEYGSVTDPDQARVLLSYSPYHHVTPGAAYPPVLFTAADGDTRVDPLHARKMCAALQHASSGDGPVLFRFERGVGHGARARSRAVELQADCLAFLAAHVGLSLEHPDLPVE